jgi:hypothetical protein
METLQQLILVQIKPKTVDYKTQWGLMVSFINILTICSKALANWANQADRAAWLHWLLWLLHLLVTMLS